MNFDYGVQGNILCELNGQHLTCTRISTEVKERSWFFDLSISHIAQSIPHVQPKPGHQRSGRAFHGLENHDSIELKLKEGSRRWLLNANQQEGDLLVLVLDSANGAKDVAEDFKDSMQKKTLSQSKPLGGAIACQSSPRAEPIPAPVDPRMAALRDSQANRPTASESWKSRTEVADSVTVVHDSHERPQQEEDSEVEDPIDDRTPANAGYTKTKSRTQVPNGRTTNAKDARKPAKAQKAQPREDTQDAASKPSTTMMAAAQPAEDSYTQLYAQNDANHKAKPGKTYKPQAKEKEAPAKKPTQATKAAAGKRKTRSAGQDEPGDAFLAADEPVPKKKQRTKPVGKAIADIAEVEENTVASEVMTTKSSKTTSKTTTQTRKRIGHEHTELGVARINEMRQDDAPDQRPPMGKATKKSFSEVSKDESQRNRPRLQQDKDITSRVDQNRDDAAYADIDTLPQDPEPKPSRPVRKFSAKAARPTLSEQTLMAEVIDLQTPDAKSIGKPPATVHSQALALPDDRLNRKARIIEFGSRGPRNQGTESPEKQTEQKPASTLQQSDVEGTILRPKPSTDSHAPRPVMTPSHVHANEVANSQDSDVDGNDVADGPPFSAGADLGIDRTGSQLSQRVSGEGSPYSKTTRLPVARPRSAWHGLDTSSDQALKKDRPPPKVLEPPFEYVQPPKSSLPPSRNPDNDVDRPSRDLTVSRAMPVAPTFIAQPVPTLQENPQPAPVPALVTKDVQSQVAGRMLPPKKPFKPGVKSSDNSKLSDAVPKSKDIPKESRLSNAGREKAMFQYTETLVPVGSAIDTPVAALAGSRKQSKDTTKKLRLSSDGLPESLEMAPQRSAPDTPVPMLVASKKSSVPSQASSKIATEARLHPRPAQFVKPVEGSFLTHPPAVHEPGQTLRGHLNQQDIDRDSTAMVPEPRVPIIDSCEQVNHAPARLQQEPAANPRVHTTTSTSAPVAMVNMLTEPDLHESDAGSTPTLSPAARLPINEGLASPAYEMPSSDVEQEVSRVEAREPTPEPIEADPTEADPVEADLVPMAEVTADPVIHGSKFAAFLEKKAPQKQAKPLLSELSHLQGDFEDSEQTLVGGDDETHMPGAPAKDDQPEDDAENDHLQEAENHEPYDEIRMSDHSSDASDRSSGTPQKGTQDEDDEEGEGQDSDLEAQEQEQEIDAEYAAYHQHMAWQRALQPHQEEYHQSFASISNVRHAIHS